MRLFVQTLEGDARKWFRKVANPISTSLRENILNGEKGSTK